MKVTVTEDVTVVNVNSEEVYFKVLVKEGDDVLAEKFALESQQAAILSTQQAILSSAARDGAEAEKILTEDARDDAETAKLIAEAKAQEATDALDTILPIAQEIADLNLFLSRFTVELIQGLSVDFYAPQDLKITGFDAIIGTPTITILVNDSSYTLDSTINEGSKITVTTTIATVVNLSITYL
jgi:hypothetical protein